MASILLERGRGPARGEPSHDALGLTPLAGSGDKGELMHEQDPNTYTTPALYFLIGGIVGAGAALLLAPQSGRETREQLGQKLRDGAEGARHLKDNLAQKTEQVKQGASRLKERAMTAFAGTGTSAEELS
jgi:hypothetical protein